jgi:hypothetical protein
VLAAALAPLIAGCNPVSIPEPVQKRVGAVAILGSSTSATSVRATATVIVFEALSVALPSSTLSQDDACIFTGVDTAATTVRGTRRAGASVALQVGGQAVTLPFETAFQRYATPVGTTFGYAAGDTARVSIPGEGDNFPAAAISVPLVAPLLPGALSLPPAGQPLTVTWTPGGDAGAAIILSLKYPNPASSPFANAQVLCRLRDDGTHTVAAPTVEAFLGAAPTRRTITLTRWRTGEQVLDDRTVLHIVSSIDTVVTPQ